MKTILRYLTVIMLFLPYTGTGRAQTTADGSLPGGADAEERMRAAADPFVKNNEQAIKAAKLDPLVLIRAAAKLEATAAKQQTPKQSPLSDAHGVPLGAKGQVLTAYLFAHEKSVKGSDLVKELQKGTSLTEAATVALRKSREKGAQAARALTEQTAAPNEAADLEQQLKAIARTIQ